MGVFTRRMNAAKAKKASIQERGPKNPFERHILKSLVWARVHLKEIYGIRIQKMPSVVVSARTLFADRETHSAHLKELSNRGMLSPIIASAETPPDMASELLMRVKETSHALAYSSRAAYQPGLQTIRLPPTYLMFPEKTSQLGETIMHELIHHALWEQKSPVYSMKKQWLYPANSNPALNAANEGLATYLQPPGTPLIRKSKKEIAGGVLKFPITLAKRVGYTLKTAAIRPILFLSHSAATLAFAATRLKKIASVLLRNTIWRKPENFARALRTNPLAHPAFDAYSDGLEFVKKVAKEFIKTDVTFDAICHTPPSTYEEILMPERYLEKLRSLRPELFREK